MTREQEYREVRRRLGDPKNGAPTPDMIISQLLRIEQSMLNDISGLGKAWSVETTTITTVANQAEYALSVSDFGKALFVYQDLGNNVIREVPTTDYVDEFFNQKYDFTLVPALSGVTPGFYGDKIAFFGLGSPGTREARVFPIPETAGTVYTIKYAKGAIDPSAFTWSDVPLFPEWSYLRINKAALYLLDRTEWDGFSRADTIDQRKQSAMSIAAEIAEEQPKYDAFIRNPQNDPPGDSGYWWEG